MIVFKICHYLAVIKTSTSERAQIFVLGLCLPLGLYDKFLPGHPQRFCFLIYPAVVLTKMLEPVWGKKKKRERERERAEGQGVSSFGVFSFNYSKGSPLLKGTG